MTIAILLADAKGQPLACDSHSDGDPTVTPSVGRRPTKTSQASINSTCACRGTRRNTKTTLSINQRQTLGCLPAAAVVGRLFLYFLSQSRVCESLDQNRAATASTRPPIEVACARSEWD